MKVAESPGSLFQRRLRDLIARPPVTCGLDVSAVQVARRFSRESIGSVVVVDEAGVPVGIVTDHDLRARVVAEGRDASTTPARAIMSAPLITLPPAAFAFEAVLEMTRHRLRHVVVVEDGRLRGVVSSRDLLALQTAHPVTLARDLDRAGSVDAGLDQGPAYPPGGCGGSRPNPAGSCRPWPSAVSGRSPS
jgi:CBS domain-containing protein